MNINENRFIDDAQRRAEDSDALTIAYMQGVADEREKHRDDDGLMDDMATALEEASGRILSARPLCGSCLSIYPFTHRSLLRSWDGACPFQRIRFEPLKQKIQEILDRYRERRT